METSRDERLEQAVATLNDLIEFTRTQGLPETAHFLAMAKLNLLIEFNGITEREFRALCAAVERDADASGKRPARPVPARGRRIEGPGTVGSAVRRTWTRPGRLAGLRANGARGKP